MDRGDIAARSPAIALPPTVAVAMDMHLLWPIITGLVAVIVARIAFVDRENRGKRKHQTFREFAPLTAVAMLIEVALIIDRDLPVPLAIFWGLGIGFSTILILDTIGDRIAAAIAVLFGVSKPPPAPHNLIMPPAPTDEQKLIEAIDRADDEHQAGQPPQG